MPPEVRAIPAVPRRPNCRALRVASQFRRHEGRDAMIELCETGTVGLIDQVIP